MTNGRETWSGSTHALCAVRRSLCLTTMALSAACASAGKGGNRTPRGASVDVGVGIGVATAANTATEQLLTRAIAYAGGDAALSRARALTWDGEAIVHAGGRTVPIAGRWAIQPPDSAIVATYAVANGPTTMRSLIVAAPRGWTESKGAFTPLPATMLANERDEFYLYSVMRLVTLRAPGVTLVAVARDSSGNEGLGVRQTGRPDVDLFIGKDGRVVRLVTIVADASTGKPAREELAFEGSLSASGIRWPHILRITLEGAPYFDLTMRNLRVYPRLDEPLLRGPK
ncbi:MAG: hypothetical protein ABIT38_02835 [Gemmatimonadaceae bacterium]